MKEDARIFDPFKRRPRPQWEPVRPKPDPLSEVLKEMRHECTGCGALLRIFDNYKFCPHCGCLLKEEVDLEHIKDLLVLINAKIGRYLQQKRLDVTKSKGKV